MIARLADHYGSPAELLGLPIGMLEILDRQIARLRARRLLNLHATVRSATSGRMSRADVQQFVRELEREANEGERPKKATAADLERMGIPVNPGRDGEE
jgi:hypothetical protein